MTKYTGNEFDEFYMNFSDFNDELFNHLANLIQLQPSNILDLACGSGISTRAIAKIFENASIIGTDISNELIARANSTYVPTNVNYELSSVQELLKSNRKFDLIIVKSAFHLLKSAGITSEQLLRLATKHGMVCLLEKTEVCVDSYLLFPEATKIWKEQVSNEQRGKLIIEAHEEEDTHVTTSRYGKSVKIGYDDYFQGIKKKQISCLWQFSDKVINSFLRKHNSLIPSLFIFEDYDIVVLSKQV